MKKKIIIGIGIAVLAAIGTVGGLVAFSNKDSDSNNVAEIVDKTADISGFMCATVLDDFYEDAHYVYSWSCSKNNYMVVRYNDGSEELVSEALKAKRIIIHDLDTYRINYLKTAK